MREKSASDCIDARGLFNASFLDFAAEISNRDKHVHLRIPLATRLLPTRQVKLSISTINIYDQSNYLA